MGSVKNKILFEHSRNIVSKKNVDASLFCLARQSVMGDGAGSRLDFFGSFFGNAKKNKAE
ncbi:MAG: hypothetical protein CL867_02380 [Cytophagaceae bacterium]|nr:hypothetical protein [Cytophagaceae bacterium]